VEVTIAMEPWEFVFVRVVAAVDTVEAAPLARELTFDATLVMPDEAAEPTLPAPEVTVATILLPPETTVERTPAAPEVMVEPAPATSLVT
jgi:hypothetical protein